MKIEKNLEEREKNLRVRELAFLERKRLAGTLSPSEHLILAQEYQLKHGTSLIVALSRTAPERRKSQGVPADQKQHLDKARAFQVQHGGSISDALLATTAKG